MANKAAPAAPVQVRLDKWLWAARFFKTRQLAIDAIHAGRIHVGDERIKPAKTIKVGDCIGVRHPPYTWSIVVTGLAEKRGSAQIAQSLYVETAESMAAREALRADLKDMPPPLFPGRPTKKDRRTLARFFDHQSDHDRS